MAALVQAVVLTTAVVRLCETIKIRKTCDLMVKSLIMNKNLKFKVI